MSATEFENSVWLIIGKIAIFYTICWSILGIANMAISKTSIGSDDTDPPNGRSDLIVFTDHRTGCQYLSSKRGGLTPRFDSNGKHICTREGGTP